jgi:hypothetical protein
MSLVCHRTTPEDFRGEFIVVENWLGVNMTAVIELGDRFPYGSLRQNKAPHEHSLVWRWSVRQARRGYFDLGTL